MNINMEHLEKHVLDYDLTYAYILNQLEDGKSLSQNVIKKSNFKEGFFYTLLPRNANLDALYLFKNGGIIPQEKEKKLIDFYGSKVWYQELTSIRETMIEYVYDYIKKNASIAVLEEGIREKKDGSNEINNVHISYLEEEIYYFLNTTNSYEEVSNALKSTAHAWQFLGVLTNQQIEFCENLAQEQLEAIASSIQSMVVVAYDGESYIFWEKSQS